MAVFLISLYFYGRFVFTFMLKLLEFRALSSAEKAAYVLKHGQYIHFRTKGWCKIDLYLIKSGPNPADSFYAELWYYYDLKSVGLVRVFETMPPLEPYTENIKLRYNGK